MAASRVPHVSVLHLGVLILPLYVGQEGQIFVPNSIVPRCYATHFIINFFRFFAQSSRYRSISF
jgi:hypothetical protein